MTAALVSVVIPVFNGAQFIAEALQSALTQDYPVKEIIVINDGSTDNTLSVLRSFGESIHVIDQANCGPPNARNAGLRKAQGEFVAFLDADDVWIQGKLRAQVAHLNANSDVGTVYTSWHIWSPDTDGKFNRPSLPHMHDHSTALDELDSGWLYNRLLFDCKLLTTTVMMRASVIRSIGQFDSNMFNGDDYDYWLRASRVGKIHKLRAIGALYRTVQNSVSRRPREINYEYEVIRKAVGRWGLTGPDGTKTTEHEIRKRYEQLLLQHGYIHLESGNPKIAFDSFRDVLRLNPLRFKVWAKAAFSVCKLKLGNF